MFTNPFCFVVQVLAGLIQVQPPVFCALPGLPVVLADGVSNELQTRGDWMKASKVILPTIRISAHVPTSGTAEHVVHQAFIRSNSSPITFSGFGSSASETMFTNPFCFVVQVLAGLIQVQPPVFCALPGLPVVLADDVSNELQTRGDWMKASKVILPTIRISAHVPTSGTAEHVVHQAFIRSNSSPITFSGLGSSASETMFTNPFCFVVQK
ncbi:uncharacterized protein LOC125942920 [Dermacentor silvarum]|uniref:uncharacterized protein LOC125942920 n=1 Tax=Dermacentor silvarum TaxID=543639 RepID=UPI002100EB43|nr:uncharacterized protein LOC125942920 [Dermacentor silvarum]